MKSVDLMSLWAFLCSVHLCKSVRERKALCERKITNHVNRRCQDILQNVPLYNREKAEFETRRGSFTFENMPFLRQEGRLLRARRAYTRMQNIIRWFIVGYILGYRRCYLRVVRVVSMVGCKDFLSSHELSSLTYITPNESWNALCSLYAEGVLWARNCAQKCSVNSVRSVRDKTPQRVVCVLSHQVGAFYFSQKNTEKQNAQHSTETLSQPISQNVTANIHHPTPFFS